MSVDIRKEKERGAPVSRSGNVVYSPITSVGVVGQEDRKERTSVIPKEQRQNWLEGPNTNGRSGITRIEG